MANTNNNYTQITPRAADALQRTVRTVDALARDVRARPNPFRSGGGALPPGTGQGKVLMLGDNLSPGTPVWDWPQLH